MVFIYVYISIKSILYNYIYYTMIYYTYAISIY